MHKLKDFKDEINKCSKCGLCQAVCPIYKLTGNDCAVSRGKFVMLNGVLKNDLKLNKNINKYLDLCLMLKYLDFCLEILIQQKLGRCMYIDFASQGLLS